MRIFYIAFAHSTHTIKWVKYFKDLGHDIMLVSFYPITEKIKGIDYRYIKSRNKNFPVFKIPEVKRLVEQFKPDIVHAHHASSCGLVGALLNFHPLVISVWGHDVLIFPNKSPVHKFAIGYVLKKADFITATSRKLADTVYKLVNISPEIIPFGVDNNFLEIKRDYNREELTIGIVKDLKPVYAIDILIKAFAGLVEKKYPVKLIIVGDGELKDELVNLCSRLNVSSHVSFIGRVHHTKIVDMLKGFDIFAVPSLSESFGVAAVEAMATGLPVVASDVGGLPEVVDDGITGRLVKPGDVESLKNALEHYILSRDIRIEHGRKGREKVEKEYNWQENAEKMHELYKKILKRLHK